MWVMSRTGQIIRTWASCKPQTTSPTRTHWSTTIVSRKMVAHEGGFLSLFTRLNANRKEKKTGKGGLGTRRLEHDFPNRLLAVSVTWKCCAVVWSFCVLVGHCAVCTLGAELNIEWLVLARCCHAKPIHGACKRHTVQVSLHSLFS